MPEVKVKLSSGNRVVIPMPVVKNLGLNIGDEFILSIESGKIVFTKTGSNISTERPKVADKPIKKTTSKPNKFKSKIYCNLEESKNYSKKKYSECGLVVRTKTRYINKLCEECRGWLACEYNVPDKCRFNRKDNGDAKEIIKSKPKKEEVKKSKPKKEDLAEYNNYKLQKRTKILPFKSENLVKCNSCGELVVSGFLAGYKKYCGDCMKSQFKDFMALYEKYDKRRK